jgi:hypothetical protein
MSNVNTSSLRRVIGSVCLVAGLVVSANALATDTLIVNQSMKPNQHLTSANGKYRLVFQPDGNLVLQRQTDHTQLWASDTAKKNGKRLVLGSDGNLRLETHGKTPAWTSDTGSSRVNRLTVHDDGNVAMYDTANKQIWSTGTSQDVSTRASTAVVTYVGQANGVKTAGSTMTVTSPTTTATGNLIILTIQSATGAVPNNAGSGWTIFARCQVEGNTATNCSTSSTASDLGLSIFYRYATGSGAVTYTINKPSDQFTAANLLVVRNAASSNPIATGQGRFIDNGLGTTADPSLETKTTCPAFTALSRGMNVCAMAHDDAQPMLTPTNWTLRSSSTLIQQDSALIIYTRPSTSTALAATTVNYDGNVIDGDLKGNGVNITYQIKPIP